MHRDDRRLLLPMCSLDPVTASASSVCGHVVCRALKLIGVVVVVVACKSDFSIGSKGQSRAVSIVEAEIHAIGWRWTMWSGVDEGGD